MQDNQFEYSVYLEGKISELQEQLGCRRGVMVVGESRSGKSSLIEMARQLQGSPELERMNPSSMSQEKLLGWLEREKQEWVEGVLT